MDNMDFNQACYQIGGVLVVIVLAVMLLFFIVLIVMAMCYTETMKIEKMNAEKQSFTMFFIGLIGCSSIAVLIMRSIWQCMDLIRGLKHFY